MKILLVLCLAFPFLFAFTLRADGPSRQDIQFAQEWAFALAASVKAQVNAGAKDPASIRKKATEDTQPQEKKLRAVMKENGLTPKETEQAIREERKMYLDSFIDSFLKGKP